MKGQIPQTHFPKDRLSQQGKTQTNLHVRAIRSRATGARQRHIHNLQINPSHVKTMALNGGWHAWATTRKLIRFFSICFTKCFLNESKIFLKRKFFYLENICETKVKLFLFFK